MLPVFMNHLYFCWIIQFSPGFIKIKRTVCKLFVFLCAFNIQDYDEDQDQIELNQLKQARFESMIAYSKRLEKGSVLFVNDLSLKSKFIAVGPFTCFELWMGVRPWVLFEYEEINTKEFGILYAAQEDPDHQHDCIVTLYKTDTSIPSDHLDKFLNCMVEGVTFKQTAQFFEDCVLGSLEGSKHNDAKLLKKKIGKRVGIVKSNKSNNNKKKACKGLWHIWFDRKKIRGLCGITRWLRQDTNVNIECLESPLERKIKAEMGADFKWRNGTLGTVNILSTPIHGLNYDDARKSPLSDHMPAGFWSFGSHKRLITGSKDFGAAITEVRRKQYQPEADHEFNEDDYACQLLLKYNAYGDYMFIECEVGQTIQKGVDRHIQNVLRDPDIFQYANKRKWTYFWGVDEYRKLSAQQQLFDKVKEFEKRWVKQKSDIDKLRGIKQAYENDLEEDDMDIDKGDDKNSKRNKRKKDSEESDTEDKDKDKNSYGNDKEENEDSDDDILDVSHR